MSQCNQVSLQILRLLNLSYSPGTVERKNCSGERRGCRNHCFSVLFFDVRHLGQGAACPVSFVSMVAGQRYQARCFAIKGATYQP
jgi:hypothetical protein